MFSKHADHSAWQVTGVNENAYLLHTSLCTCIYMPRSLSKDRCLPVHSSSRLQGRLAIAANLHSLIAAPAMRRRGAAAAEPEHDVLADPAWPHSTQQEPEARRGGHLPLLCCALPTILLERAPQVQSALTDCTCFQHTHVAGIGMNFVLCGLHLPGCVLKITHRWCCRACSLWGLPQWWAGLSALHGPPRLAALSWLRHGRSSLVCIATLHAC